MTTPVPPAPSDPLARGLSASELAEIEAAKQAAKVPSPPEVVKWGPLSPVALLALDYVRQAHDDSQERIDAFIAREEEGRASRFAAFVEAVVGRKPPLLEGHGVAARQIDGQTYLVAVPAESA